MALITGAAGGIGSAVERRLSEEGAKLVVVDDLDLDAARSAAESLPGNAIGDRTLPPNTQCWASFAARP